ncbi:MAG TPA: RnfH family protein [Gammaproteobacteria bacterium]|nr:RnfH family protein [Xanthomonadales bacterium]MCB1594797.1 RnfH family protein [Xanthomonadales bacterium]HOP23616.1 RnfH family protein [Gammaproteobacteria bacterium]HPI96056.1 RnfH family protein [Gammaproteobacteria bacterium]HPQ87566.1 RnfH family protein [Gammaproteobacteria bacterium]
MINVEVAYALPEKQEIIKLQVNKKTTIEQAIKQSGLLEVYTAIDLFSEDSANKVGIFSQIKSLDEIVNDGDRIEIYRPLIADPKEVRKKRAEQQREQGIVK